jgi:hypothetical protein
MDILKKQLFAIDGLSVTVFLALAVVLVYWFFLRKR